MSLLEWVYFEIPTLFKFQLTKQIVQLQDCQKASLSMQNALKEKIPVRIDLKTSKKIFLFFFLFDVRT